MPELAHDGLRDLLGRGTRIIAPVVGINLVADSDIAHALRQFERADLVGGVRLLVDRVRRTEERGLDAELGRQQALGQVQLDAQVLRADDADVGMGEGVIADLVAFAKNPLEQRGILSASRPMVKNTALTL